MIKKTTILYLLATLLATGACKTKQSQNETRTEQAKLVPAPAFNADSAFNFVDRQVAFGPRVPNTPAHQKAGDYMIAKLKEYGWEVTVQAFTATTYDGKKLNARNIIGSFNPQAAKRILLTSHWDSRPMADENAATKTRPVPGANDGASGVGVLLELARTIRQSQNKPKVGIDIIFFDAEDWGNSELAKDDFGGFCLGSRHWAANLHKPGYSAYYGVLLDMVGAKGATFLKEGTSMQYAPSVVNNIWQLASQLGYSQYFVDQLGPTLTDDHVPVNTIAKIPMIDIIHLSTGGDRTFFEDWHTVEDDMRNIDRGTLKAVGQTLVQAVYNEE